LAAIFSSTGRYHGHQVNLIGADRIKNKNWSSIVSHECEIEKRTVLIYNGLQDGHCERDCNHECKYNFGDNRVIRPIKPKKKATELPEQKTTAEPKPPKKKPVKLPKLELKTPEKLEPEEEEDDPSDFKIVKSSKNDIPVLEGKIICKKTGTEIKIDECIDSGCGSYIAKIRHEKTMKLHVRCTYYKGLTTLKEVLEAGEA